MELFYCPDAAGGLCRLSPEESAHCVKVLRHRAGDTIHVIDGAGTLYRCEILSDSPKGVEASVSERIPDWGGHPYRLTLAVCPTKNSDRYEWFAEKATELGADRIVPVIGDRSERRVFKTDRLRKIVLSAAKQSLKARIPEIAEPLKVSQFIAGSRPDGRPDSERPCPPAALPVSPDALKLICYCFEDDIRPRISIREVLGQGGGPSGQDGDKGGPSENETKEIIVLIGPEGDFSPEEVAAALAAGFLPVHLGASRLRTETAAVTAAAAVYFHYL